MAPAISAGFAASIFMLVKLVVHMRRNPVPWAIYTWPFFFLIAGTICTLSIVYKGSPNLKLNKKPAWYIASLSLGVGGGLCILAAFFFVPYVHSRVLKRDQNTKWWHFVYGPALLKREIQEGERAKVPNYAVVQEDEDDISFKGKSSDSEAGVIDDEIIPAENEKALVKAETRQKTHAQLVSEGEERLHAKLRKKRGPIGWAMRTLHKNPMGTGQIYE